MTTPVASSMERQVQERGLMSLAQIESCRRVAEEIRARFGVEYPVGRIVVERLWTLRRDLRPQLATPHGRSQLLGELPPELPMLSADDVEALLERGIARGLVGPSDRAEAMRIRLALIPYGVHRTIGGILFDLGRLDPERLDARAAEAGPPSPAPPRPRALPARGEPGDPARLPSFAFDRIAVDNGLVSEEVVAECRSLQLRIEAALGLQLPIGRILYETGHLELGEVEAILDAQVRVGRLDQESASFRVLKLTRLEREELVRILVSRGTLPIEELAKARTAAARLRELGLSIDTVEILWLQGRIPDPEMEGVLRHQEHLLAWSRARTPRVRLSLTASKDAIRIRGPGDLPDRDLLFGECAWLAGAVDRVELERAHGIFHQCREELELPLTFGEILAELYGLDPVRIGRLEEARAAVEEILGSPYRLRALRLGPLERSALERRVAARSPDLDEPLARAAEASARLARLGIERSAIEILIDRNALPDEWVASLLEGTQERERRLAGGWRRQELARDSLPRSLFLSAFRRLRNEPGWSRSLFGNLAVEDSLVDPDDLARALYAQLRAREIGLPRPIGEVMVEMGLLRRSQVKRLLARQQQRLRSNLVVSDGPAPTATDLLPGDRWLYEHLLSSGAVPALHLQEALRMMALLREVGLKGDLREILKARGLEIEPPVSA